MPGNLHAAEDRRAASEVLDRVADKWTVLVAGALGGGRKRFNEFRRALGGVSQRTPDGVTTGRDSEQGIRSVP
jgi:DNA-binding HxlR family transcriptional regulator